MEMWRIFVGFLVFGLVLTTANGQKQFSGRWKMDAARSESAHQAVPVGPVTLSITQSATEIRIETAVGDAGGSGVTTETLTYKLDGSENTITTGANAPVKTRARFEGAKLVLDTARTVNGTPVTMRHTLTLAGDGKQLIIDKTLTVQHGYQSPSGNNTGTGTDVFIRTGGPTGK